MKTDRRLPSTRSGSSTVLAISPNDSFKRDVTTSALAGKSEAFGWIFAWVAGSSPPHRKKDSNSWVPPWAADALADDLPLELRKGQQNIEG